MSPPNPLPSVCFVESFTSLMQEVRDLFIENLDGSENGLHGKMANFSQTLREHDPELADHLDNLELDPRYFALRWFTTLLCREFYLPDTIRLWDSLFAVAGDRFRFLIFVFVALLMEQRVSLLSGDFASNLKLLQDYPPIDITLLLSRTHALVTMSARRRDGRGSVGGGAAAVAVATATAAVNGLNDPWVREASESAKAAAVQMNTAVKKLWQAAGEMTAGAAERAGLG
ncbi:unnamed protein product [Choristocarpus tenellus]